MTKISRRGALGASLASAGAIVAGGGASAAGSPVQGACFLTPQAEEGPFYLDPRLHRSDITEGRPGVPLDLRLMILDAACRPLPDVRVDVWHADARGVYSGYPGQGDDRRASTEGQTFLRGTQMSGRDGLVRFATIYPGWYDGRAPHIHVKAFAADAGRPGGHAVLTGQMYFPDALSEYIYANDPAYAGRPVIRETVNRNDRLIADSDPAHLAFVAVKEDPTRYVASLTLGLDPAASPASEPHRPPPPPGGFGARPPQPHIADRARALLPGRET